MEKSLLTMLNLPPIVLVLVVFASIAVVASQLTPKSQKRGRKHPVHQAPAPVILRPSYHKRPLLSSGELAFYTELQTAVDPYFRIFTKVRLWDIIDVNKDLSWRERKIAQNKISSKHVDFVAFSPQDGVVRLVIELDDRSHSRPDRRRRDVEVDNMLAAVGIPIIHLPAAYKYDAEEVRVKVFTAIRASSLPKRT